MVAFTVPRGDCSSPRVALAAPRGDCSSPSVAFTVPRGDCSSPSVALNARGACSSPMVAFSSPRGACSSSVDAASAGTVPAVTNVRTTALTAVPNVLKVFMASFLLAAYDAGRQPAVAWQADQAN